MTIDFVTLGEIIDHMEMEKVYAPNEKYKETKIITRHINRIGLDLIGSLREFDPSRLMIFGESEKIFLDSLKSDARRNSMDAIFSFKSPAMLVTRGITLHSETIEVAKKYETPIFVSQEGTAVFINDLTEFLSEFLSPKVTRSAGFMSIHGEGVLIIGESGIGKSEVELELIKRGHKFVSDDVTEIRRISARTLYGYSPGNISKFIEVRGIGIVNIQQLFGVDSIKKSERIDLVASLEMWQDGIDYKRLGDEEKYIEILDIKVPYVSIPVKPGKNLAVIVEVAAMHNRLKKFGINPYGELMAQLGMSSMIEPPPPTLVKCIWDIE